MLRERAGSSRQIHYLHQKVGIKSWSKGIKRLARRYSSRRVKRSPAKRSSRRARRFSWKQRNRWIGPGSPGSSPNFRRWDLVSSLQWCPVQTHQQISIHYFGICYLYCHALSKGPQKWSSHSSNTYRERSRYRATRYERHSINYNTRVSTKYPWNLVLTGAKRLGSLFIREMTTYLEESNKRLDGIDAATQLF